MPQRPLNKIIMVISHMLVFCRVPRSVTRFREWSGNDKCRGKLHRDVDIRFVRQNYRGRYKTDFILGIQLFGSEFNIINRLKLICV